MGEKKCQFEMELYLKALQKQIQFGKCDGTNYRGAKEVGKGTVSATVKYNSFFM